MDDSKTILRQQAWDYFTIVAAQRLTVLNFYIALSSIIASVQFAMLQNEQLSYAGIFLGAFLVFLSFVFWKWDRRSYHMIRIAEDALKHFEDSIELIETTKEPHILKIFRREEYLTKNKKKSIYFWNNYFTYSTCMKLIFAGFSVVGITGIIIYFIKYLL